MKRTLSLKTEHLAELASAELAEVVGAAIGGILTGIYPTMPLKDCTARVTEQTCTW